MNKNRIKLIWSFVAILAFYCLSNLFYKRFDLTQDKRYTLSKTTTDILNNIRKPLLVKVYLSGDFPPEFKRLQVAIAEFLQELQARNSNINVRFLSPNGLEKKLLQRGMTPSRLMITKNGTRSEAIIFPWAELVYNNKTTVVPLLTNAVARSKEAQFQQAIEAIEFHFSTALADILKANKQKIAVLKGNGELQDIYLYSLLRALGKKYHLAKFTLDSVAKNPQKTLEELTTFDLVLIANPTQKFTSKEKFTLDQFITNGGKTLWMLDNVQATQDSLFNSGKMLAYPRDTNLTDLLFSYGVRINYALIEDLYAAKIAVATGKIGNQPQFENLDWPYHPLVNGNPKNPITKNILPVRLQFANQIDTLKNSIKKTPLLVSSTLTRKVGVPRFIRLQRLSQKPNPNNYRSGAQLFAVLLEGNFTSAYKNRIKPFKTPLFKGKSPSNKIVVISDGAVAKNQIFNGKPYDLSLDKWTHQHFGNKDFILNSIAYLLDDNGLINLRNKTVQIAFLDTKKAYAERSFWRFINLVFPLLLLFFFGGIFSYLQRKKYTQKLGNQ